jgi:hypothetical protein
VHEASITVLKGSYEDKNHIQIRKIHISHICVIRLTKYPVIHLCKNHTVKRNIKSFHMCQHTPQQALNKEYSCAIQSVFLVDQVIRAVKYITSSLHNIYSLKT